MRTEFTTMPLGRLRQVDPRIAWPHEALNLTPWLAGEENLSLLAETLGIELQLETQEQSVGPFRADIVCIEPMSGHKVLIENQLEKTDHCHLGQVITYAAGLEAVTIVWIARTFTNEHRAAVDWLNTISDEGFRFFALEVQLWQIGESEPAPKFNVVAQPNNWSKSVKASASPVSPTSTWSTEFWSGFSEYLRNQLNIIPLGKPADQYYLRICAYDKNQVWYAYYNTKAKRLGINLWFGGPYWRAYLEQTQLIPDIEERLGPVSWVPAKQSGSAYFHIEGMDAKNQTAWPMAYKEMADRLLQCKDVLDQIVPTFKDEDWQSPLSADVTITEQEESE